MPDFLPVCLQDQLWDRKPAVREKGRQIIRTVMKMPPDKGGIFYLFEMI